MAYLDRRQRNIEVFEDTRDWYGRDPKLKQAVQRSCQGTQFYAPGEVELPPERLARHAGATRVLVTRNRTFQAAGRYAGQRVAVLNFAAATNPGGGVTCGSSTQEEALCRCSTLYPCLLRDELWRNYYQMHRDRRDAAYTDACIYTPDVLIIKTDTDAPRRLPEDKMQAVDVITCAAPNLRERPSNAMNPGAGSPVHLSRQDIYSLHTQRPARFSALPSCMTSTCSSLAPSAAALSATRLTWWRPLTGTCCRNSPTLFAPWNSQSTARPGTTSTTRFSMPL